MSNQNAGADRKSCRLMQAAIAAHFAARLKWVNVQCLDGRVADLVDAAQMVLVQIGRLKANGRWCDCHECARPMMAIGHQNPHRGKVQIEKGGE